MKRPFYLCLGICASILLLSSQQVSARSKPPVIQHNPVTVALQGQSIIIKATVTDDAEVKSVTLYYSTSKDIAPFKLAMQPAGQNLFVCTVPDNLLSQATIMTYYIEAMDKEDQTKETQWYTVSIQPADSGAKKEGGAGSKDSAFWKRTALIGGGVVIAGGTAAALAGGGGGGSDTPPPGSGTNEYVGTYIGSVTAYLEFTAQPAQTLSHETTIRIDESGTVSSSDLYTGETMTAMLSGSDFTLIAHVSETNLTGQINFYGNLIHDRIAGSLGGSVETASGTNGTYYGYFNAVKQ